MKARQMGEILIVETDAHKQIAFVQCNRQTTAGIAAIQLQTAFEGQDARLKRLIAAARHVGVAFDPDGSGEYGFTECLDILAELNAAVDAAKESS